jgi:heterodisulfide reductase subunit A-like polyferredoxin
MDSDEGELREEKYDMLVLSVGMTLPGGVKSLATQLGIGCGEEGFLDTGKAGGGVFVTGACGGPKDIEHSIMQAKSTAAEVFQYLRGRS